MLFPRSGCHCCRSERLCCVVCLCVYIRTGAKYSCSPSHFPVVCNWGLWYFTATWSISCSVTEFTLAEGFVVKELKYGDWETFLLEMCSPVKQFIFFYFFSFYVV